MAKTDKALRKVKKDAATAARVLRAEVPQQPGYKGVATKKEKTKRVNAGALRAEKRDINTFDAVSSKGFDATPRENQVFRAMRTGRSRQFTADVNRSKVGSLVQGVDMPRKGIVGKK
jgi:hypothetical protein